MRRTLRGTRLDSLMSSLTSRILTLWWSDCPIAACAYMETLIALLVFDGDIDENLKAVYMLDLIMPFNDLW